jgi:hypothetical protein
VLTRQAAIALSDINSAVYGDRKCWYDIIYGVKRGVGEVSVHCANILGAK